LKVLEIDDEDKKNDGHKKKLATIFMPCTTVSFCWNLQLIYILQYDCVHDLLAPQKLTP